MIDCYQISNMIQTNVNPAKGSLLALLLPLLKPLCGECGKLVSGQVRLTNGLLAGLSQLARSGPVVLDWDEGAVRIAAGLMIKSLGVPFSGEASVRDIKVNPDVNTRVDKVGVDFGIQVRQRKISRVLFHQEMSQFPSLRVDSTRNP